MAWMVVLAMIPYLPVHLFFILRPEPDTGERLVTFAEARKIGLAPLILGSLTLAGFLSCARDGQRRLAIPGYGPPTLFCLFWFLLAVLLYGWAG